MYEMDSLEQALILAKAKSKEALAVANAAQYAANVARAAADGAQAAEDAEDAAWVVWDKADSEEFEAEMALEDAIALDDALEESQGL